MIINVNNIIQHDKIKLVTPKLLDKHIAVNDLNFIAYLKVLIAVQFVLDWTSDKFSSFWLWLDHTWKVDLITVAHFILIN